MLKADGLQVYDRLYGDHEHLTPEAVHGLDSGSQRICKCVTVPVQWRRWCNPGIAAVDQVYSPTVQFVKSTLTSIDIESLANRTPP